MSKQVIARCDYPNCNEIVHEWIHKKGDMMDNKDYCIEHRRNL